MKAALAQARAALDALLNDAHALAAAQSLIDAVVACYKSGGKAIVCGNGGSSCDAAHFAEELTGRFRNDRPAIPALAVTDVGHVTCTANDYGFDAIFSRFVEAHARPGDAVIVLSTSGNSENLLRAVQAAKSKRAVTCALLGKGGGKLKGLCTHEVIVPGATSDRIQELHMIVLHSLVEHIERSLYPVS